MKSHLMYKDRDFDQQAELPPNANALIQDLELETLFGAMAQGDAFLFDVVKKAVLLRLDDVEAIRYRQQLLSDCLDHPEVVKEIYRLVDEATIGRKKIWAWGWNYPESVLHSSVQTLELFLEVLSKLRQIADEQVGQFRSEGFVRLFRMLQKELDDDYIASIQEHLRQLKFEDGIFVSAELGKGCKGENYLLRRTLGKRPNRIREVLSRRISKKYSLEVDPRDESGHQALGELRERGIKLVARASAQAADHVLSFFVALKTELGFYIGCLNLRDKLLKEGEPLCIPITHIPSESTLSARGLYDVCLSLKTSGRVVGNDLSANDKRLIVITGANQGGKSTFLRSLGLAYLMAQAGMFAPAEQFSVSVSTGIFTHYKREEDVMMKSGKLDEELGRMDAIVGQIRPGCVLICNESFSSTNEREASEIGHEVIRALLEAGVRVFLVTHLFELAQEFYNERADSKTLFLRAERKADGERTFRMMEGEPLPTSYGRDLFEKIFMTVDGSAAAARMEV